ncbi:MAG: nodulation protein NfeD, partial [Dehalococcoidia bacterium]
MLRIGFRVFFLSLLVLSVVAGLGGSIIAAANQNAVHILTVDGIIVPVVADYIDRGISDAEERNA